MNTFHKSVLLQEVIDLLDVKSGKRYIDATLGGGGHTAAILERGGKVLGIDTDQEAINYVKETFKIGEDLVLIKGNFRDITKIAKESSFEKVDGIVFDLGVSSYQFEKPDRGFSFQREGPLDMRMDDTLSVKAVDLINGLTKGELYELFTTLGEEHFAKIFADRVVHARQVKPIESTVELAVIVKQAAPIRDEKIHPATRVFQALRIAVNDELNSLKEALPKAVSLLEADGRVAVISFHSLEDRIVKRAFADFARAGIGEVLTKKPVVPADAEIEQNPRSRSAKLRGFRRVLSI